MPSGSMAAMRQVQMLFNDVFYGYGLNSREIWEIVCGQSYTRKTLCEQFLNDIGHSACCYCDIDTVRSQYYFDHFVPRKKAPYLSVDPLNLYVSAKDVIVRN